MVLSGYFLSCHDVALSCGEYFIKHQMNPRMSINQLVFHEGHSWGRLALKRFQMGPTSPKTSMDTQNDGLEKVDSFKIWQCLVSMFNFWGISLAKILLSKRCLRVWPLFVNKLCSSKRCYWTVNSCCQQNCR